MFSKKLFSLVSIPAKNIMKIIPSVENTSNIEEACTIFNAAGPSKIPAINPPNTLGICILCVNTVNSFTTRIISPMSNKNL